jgi:hypothetical protein
VQFFTKWGVPDLPTEHELFCKITGLQLEEGTESEVLSQLVSFQKDRLQKSGLEAKVSDRVNRPVLTSLSSGNIIGVKPHKS